MKASIFLLVLTATVMLSIDTVSSEKAEIIGDVKNAFEKFKADFKVHYGSKEEEQKRFKIFEENVKHINENNKKYNEGKSSMIEGINKFADKSLDEVQKGLIINKPK